MAIAVNNFSDYEAVVIGRIHRLRDMLPEEELSAQTIGQILACWEIGMSYETAAEMIA
jgi:hypothetical protein